MTKTKDIVQQEAFEEIKEKNRSTAAISMGVGKTLLGLKFVDYATGPDDTVLVVAPKVSIFKSWIDEAYLHGYQHVLNRIKFTTYLSLKKQKQDYKLVVLDEVHSLKFSHEFWLSFYPGRILGLTGTPPVKKFSERAKMIKKYCPIAYTYIVDEAVDDKILNDYRIYVHYLKLDRNRNIERINRKTNRPFYVSEYDNYNYWCKQVDEAETKSAEKNARLMRMKVLQDFKSKETKAKELLSHINDKCIIFANTKAQADRICSISYHTGNQMSEQNLEDFKSGKRKTLSCVLQLVEGVNVPHLKQSIILHAYGNERKFAQRFGRNLRLMITEMATVHLLCYADTIDEEWVESALKQFNPDKIIRVDTDVL